jgi:hypothetical protein
MAYTLKTLLGPVPVTMAGVSFSVPADTFAIVRHIHFAFNANASQIVSVLDHAVGEYLWGFNSVPNGIADLYCYIVLGAGGGLDITAALEDNDCMVTVEGEEGVL